MVASGVAQRFDLFILTCLCPVFRRATFGRIPLDEWSVLLRDLYLTTHNTYNRQTSMPPVGFEPTISAGERPKTYALDRAATGTGCKHNDSKSWVIKIEGADRKQRSALCAWAFRTAWSPLKWPAETTANIPEVLKLFVLAANMEYSSWPRSSLH